MIIFNIIVMIIIDVMGISSLKFSFSILISPGKFPNQLKLNSIVLIKNPKSAIIKPIYIKNLPKLN